MFANEADFERFIRNVVASEVTTNWPEIYCLNNKKAVDILVCDDRVEPRLSFIEVKYHRAKHGRLGFGSAGGGGFQPEILTRLPKYFSQRLMWVLACETHHPDKVVVLSCEQLLPFISGGAIGSKFNNFQQRLWREANWLTHEEFSRCIVSWLVD